MAPTTSLARAPCVFESISGRNVATTYQFIATDSTAHFLHGEIIIDQTPNNDSLAPMLEYMQTDVDNLIKTLRWR